MIYIHRWNARFSCILIECENRTRFGQSPENRAPFAQGHAQLPAHFFYSSLNDSCSSSFPANWLGPFYSFIALYAFRIFGRRYLLIPFTRFRLLPKCWTLFVLYFSLTLFLSRFARLGEFLTDSEESRRHRAFPSATSPK